MRITGSVGNFGAVEQRLRELAERRLAEIAVDTALYAEAQAEALAAGRTPGTTYTGSVVSAQLPIQMELEATFDDDKAEMLFHIANKGRRSYTVRPRSRKALRWYDDGEGKVFAKKATIPAIRGDDFFRRAFENAMRRARRAG